MTSRPLDDVVLRAIEDACALGHGTVRKEGHLVGYGLDSARAIELLVKLEDEHGLVLDEAALTHVRTVADLLKLVDHTRRAG